jgi:uridine kinase
MRRIVRDTQERGRSVEEVLDQYHTTVRPMHEEWVEPSKSVADLIVHSSGASLDVAIQVLKHHVLACVREET